MSLKQRIPGGPWSLLAVGIVFLSLVDRHVTIFCRLWSRT